MKQDYYIGLDMGTESVGWAVTDVDYNLIKKRGQDYWGVYLFDEAQTAQGRRAFRTNRRRLARVRHRLNLLQELFDSEISAKDFGFFYRLENSKYFDEDKPEIARGKFLLFKLLSLILKEKQLFEYGAILKGSQTWHVWNQYSNTFEYGAILKGSQTRDA